MSEQVHITKIEKVGQGGTHAMHVEGVVNGEKVGGLVTMPTFQEAEKHGRQAVEALAKDTLSVLHEAQREQRR